MAEAALSKGIYHAIWMRIVLGRGQMCVHNGHGGC